MDHEELMQEKIIAYEQGRAKAWELQAAAAKALAAAGGLASDKTLRDEFAGLAMASFRANDEDITWIKDHGARLAYTIADAMLEARKTPTEDDT